MTNTFSNIIQTNNQDMKTVCISKGLLPDYAIRHFCEKKVPMIEPFEPELVRERNGKKVISYGTSSVGYDIRCQPKFLVFTNMNATLLDPKNFDHNNYVEKNGEEIIIPPNGFILATTVEYFRMPHNVTGIVLGKSTLARIGLSVLATPLEPGWEGNLVLEFANTTPSPMKFYANEGCGQVLFFMTDTPDTTYASRQGKYQGQTGITTARL